MSQETKDEFTPEEEAEFQKSRKYLNRILDEREKTKEEERAKAQAEKEKAEAEARKKEEEAKKKKKPTRIFGMTFD
jgi:hypothetical protein